MVTINHPTPGIVINSIFRNLMKLNTPKFRDFIVYESGLKVRFSKDESKSSCIMDITTDKGFVSFSIKVPNKSIEEITEQDLKDLEKKRYELVTNFSEKFYQKFLSIL